MPTHAVAGLFERHAEAAPEAIAVRFRDERLRYRELNQRANKLANYLAAKGIGPESRVLVCVEPSLHIAVALLAIFKVGAVYIPIDPTQPASRIRTIFDETRPSLVITQRSCAHGLAWGDVATLTLDTDAHVFEGFSAENAHGFVSPEQTAYVYYTSGTTGKPKGVMASYRNLTSYLGGVHTRYQFTNQDVVPAIARFTFSISMFELMSPLASGGTLLVLERDHILDLARMSQTLGEVTFFHAGPSLLKALLPYIKRHHPDFRVFSRVRHASSGGDMVPSEVLVALRDIFFNAEVFVIYGCSEISCMGCTYPVPRDAPVRRGCVGKPFDHMTVRVADSALRRTPVGVEGEVLFAGPGVVKGYLHNPDLTAQRFVEIDGRRFYRTGDIGRMTEDGCLELLGRSDFQVKLRGIRVELGEVEHHVRGAPGVLDCAVMARDGTGGEKVLVAYVVMDEKACEKDPKSRASAIRRHAAERLPDYMVPTAYVALPTLPLNHNMKLDRSALPVPPLESRSAPGGRARRPAESPTEKRLASLWKKLLRVDEVGLDDNFFDLGGDSMLALSLILEIDRELGVVLEGLQVLRESLGVQAAICDRRLGKPSGPLRDTVPAASGDPAVEAFHFGEGRLLYGVLFQAPARGDRGEAALICSPVGHEGVRAQFVLQRLARQLAAEGISTLRFDYYGCGDSLGEPTDAGCARWQSDIATACAELRRRTNVSKITAIGARLGGTLLWNAAIGLALARIVLWDPIVDGAAYYAALAEGHRQYLRSVQDLRFWRWPRRGRGCEELLGLTYSQAALRELKAIGMRPLAAPPALVVKWLATSQPEQQEAQFLCVRGDAGSRIEAMDLDCAWMDVARLEDIFPDVGIAKKLAEMVSEGP